MQLDLVDITIIIWQCRINSAWKIDSCTLNIFKQMMLIQPAPYMLKSVKIHYFKCASSSIFSNKINYQMLQVKCYISWDGLSNHLAKYIQRFKCTPISAHTNMKAQLYCLTHTNTFLFSPCQKEKQVVCVFFLIKKKVHKVNPNWKDFICKCRAHNQITNCWDLKFPPE
jgi:hypothetical protein